MKFQLLSLMLKVQMYGKKSSTCKASTRRPSTPGGASVTLLVTGGSQLSTGGGWRGCMLLPVGSDDYDLRTVPKRLGGNCDYRFHPEDADSRRIVKSAPAGCQFEEQSNAMPRNDVPVLRD
jgi:hypothetical protein